MTKQRLHSNLAEVDMLTHDEMKSALGHHVDQLVREELRGLKIVRFPVINLTAAGTSQSIGGAQGGGRVPGPEQGYIWALKYVIVTSSVLTDAATYTLYAGSDPTLFDPMHLVDNKANQIVNQSYDPPDYALWLFDGEQVYAQINNATIGNTYILKGVALEAPAEMQGKLF